MKLDKKIFRRFSSKSNSGKWVHRCAAPEVEGVSSEVVKAVGDSTSEFNEVEFPEYDPTPYDGGLDIVLTYGEPLPPSVAICYPRSAWDPNSRNLEEFSYGSVVAPYGQEQVKVDHEKPQNAGGLTQSSVEEKAPNGQELVPVDHEKPRNGSGFTHEDEKPFYDGNGYWAGNHVPSYSCDFWGGDFFSHGNGFGDGYDGRDHEKALIPYQSGEESYGNGFGPFGDGYNGHDHEKALIPYQSGEESYGNGFGPFGDRYDGHDHEKALIPYQGGEESYGYGMEEPQAENDFHSSWEQPCEDLFGDWLWADRGEGGSYKTQDVDNPSNGNQWNGTADYIFGLSYPYGEDRNENHSYENPIYCYEKHSHMQPFHMLVEYQESSWTQRPTYHQAYEEEVHTQTEYVSTYERHSHEQHQYGHSEYSETSWFQKPDYYKAYQEEGYPGLKYGDESYGERW